ncbi:MAG TPA: hypothetical protein VK879_02700 [Candidatus Sulfomarinibacteraceae bacterium]|nr:hypothetical protein [Candidatus Sulfomarinibacteraceae bacterium]
MRHWLITLLIYALLAGLLLLLGWGLIKVNSGQVDSGMAPDFTLTSFEGETITLSELRGQVVIINSPVSIPEGFMLTNIGLAALTASFLLGLYATAASAYGGWRKDARGLAFAESARNANTLIACIPALTLLCGWPVSWS